ncbi:MAG: preprotein translocase subunit YajC [Pseudomonadota bacterium]
MSFFISDAMAQTAAPQGGGDPLLGLIPFILLFVIFYFFLIRPQSKRVKEHKKMLEALGKGDEVVTNGGVLGRVVDIGPDFIALEIAQGTTIKVQKNYIASLMPKGTIDAAN